MHNEFEMSMMGELEFFMGIQFKQDIKRHIHMSNKVCERASEEI